MLKTAIRLAAAAWMLASGIAFTMLGILACCFGPLGAALGLPVIGLGCWMSWDAGAIAAGD